MMYRPVICGFLLFFLVITCRAQATAADFVTTAEISQDSLSTKFYKQVGRFYADVTVKNVGPSSQTITVWTNPGWSWVTDSKAVTTSQEAVSNFPSAVTLKPGGVYTSRIEMAADPKMVHRPITFRLGFLPNAQLPIMDDRDPALVWTNRVTLTQ